MFNNITLETIFKKYIDKIDHPIVAIETGCSFAWAEENLPYLSTLCIVKHLVAPTDGILYSLDNDKDNISICQSHLKNLGLDKYVKFILGDSVNSIKNMKAHGVNFVWLDSCEDSNHAVEEHSAIQPLLNDNHILCVDDFGCANSVKWQMVSEIIKNTFDSYDTYTTPTGLIVGHGRTK